MTSYDLGTTLEKVSRIIGAALTELPAATSPDRYGLRLVCRGEECKTGGKTIYLPSLPENMPDSLLGPIRGWTDHECAHAMGSIRPMPNRLTPPHSGCTMFVGKALTLVEGRRGQLKKKVNRLSAFHKCRYNLRGSACHHVEQQNELNSPCLHPPDCSPPV